MKTLKETVCKDSQQKKRFYFFVVCNTDSVNFSE